LRQNSKILVKLDTLISRVSKLESICKKNDDDGNGNVDMDFIKVRLKFNIKLYVGSCRFV